MITVSLTEIIAILVKEWHVIQAGIWTNMFEVSSTSGSCSVMFCDDWQVPVQTSKAQLTDWLTLHGFEMVYAGKYKEM